MLNRPADRLAKRDPLAFSSPEFYSSKLLFTASGDLVWRVRRAVHTCAGAVHYCSTFVSVTRGFGYAQVRSVGASGVSGNNGKKFWENIPGENREWVRMPPRELLLRVHVILHRAVSARLDRVVVLRQAIEELKKSGTKRVSKSFPWS
jgi:hypothetical protein